jgi:hypothetical protein
MPYLLLKIIVPSHGFLLATPQHGSPFATPQHGYSMLFISRVVAPLTCYSPTWLFAYCSLCGSPLATPPCGWSLLVAPPPDSMLTTPLRGYSTSLVLACYPPSWLLPLAYCCSLCIVIRRLYSMHVVPFLVAIPHLFVTAPYLCLRGWYSCPPPPSPFCRYSLELQATSKVNVF